METVKNIQEIYSQTIAEDKDKSYLQILPSEFTDGKKRKSLINRYILYNLEVLDETLTKSRYFKGVDIKQIIRYVMFKKSNYKLAQLFFDRYHTIRLEPYTKEYNELSLENQIQRLTQNWEAYENRQSVKKGQLVHNYDMLNDGFPDEGRGCICYLYTPVKGVYPKNAIVGDTLTFLNPRSKRDISLQVIGVKNYYDEINILKCSSDNGDIFLLPIGEIEDAYSALFPINKEIFSGWWNRTLISK